MALGIRQSIFFGNRNTKEVHDLAHTVEGGNGCQINEIILAGHGVLFEPDSLARSEVEGYDPCDKCLPK
jgi:hypothetical protein